MDAFRSKKQRLREDLQRSRSRISISFDLWTSPNPYAILGVVAMWIDTAGKRQTTVLDVENTKRIADMKRRIDSLEGEKRANSVVQVLCEQRTQIERSQVVQDELMADMKKARRNAFYWQAQLQVVTATTDALAQDNARLRGQSLGDMHVMLEALGRNKQLLFIHILETVFLLE
ncbi:hypothetical protein B0J13DRAFT_682446 [Dactylonectria estremocensis]|uniref:Uncharacterized protein n=1 Tax=Dactylonectria estremocensis TaxID=1079267 RepID=A0A9P9CX61_9HYPO|nr:hypothetical protein B0J13DRAFT_682446 [Dactylonectria estremocensis]